MASMHYPTLLRALRRARELTQEQLAREIGVSFSTVNVWENGHRRPQPFLARRIVELARAAGLDPEEFRDAGNR
jgi:transcriptional regulator with XRE-family HTH domain